jgi:hypothetical protein
MTYWINQALGWGVFQTASGFDLINEFGFVGTFPSLEKALSANRRPYWHIA